MPIVSRIGAVVLSALCSLSFASESGDLLDAFNQLSAEGPTPTYDQWDGVGGLDSEDFKLFYQDRFKQYGDTGIAVAERALACSRQDIPQADGYRSMYDVTSVFEQARSQMSRINNQLMLWVSFNDQGARKELDSLIPTMTITFGKALFELSSCSGYLNGELVN